MALSRTCNLDVDFPGCLSVAAWQQCLALQAWTRWEGTHHIRTRSSSLCINWSGCEFTAPGPSALYTFGQVENGGSSRTLPAVWALNVLDHTDAPVRFLSLAAQLLRKHGLLFLTFTFWDAEGEDTAVGHRARARIYDIHSWKKLIVEARKIGFQPFGGTDWAYHGDRLDDHSLASLVLTRR